VKKAAGEKPKGALAICIEFMNNHNKETGETIHINHATIINHAKGKPTCAQANTTKAWLTEGETKIVLEFIVEQGNWGIPLSHFRLKEHVDEILCAHLADAFWPEGVGKHWNNQFIERHSMHIVMAWSMPLEGKQGCSVNSNTHEAWFKILHKTLDKYNILEELTYGSDKIGVTGMSGRCKTVMGGAHPGPHYQQLGGGQKNTTVII
jgi:hypothetical protein